MFLLIPCSMGPLGASFSGALDRMLFDMAAGWLAHPSSQQVAIVNTADGDADARKSRATSIQAMALLRALRAAASVTFDYEMPGEENETALALEMVRHGGIVVPTSNRAHAFADLAETLPAAAAAHGQRHLVLGHQGVVAGFMPRHRGQSNIVLEAVRVAGFESTYRSLLEPVHADALSAATLHASAVYVMPSGPGHVPQYSLKDVVDGKVPASALSDRVVFVGSVNGEDGGFRTSALDMEEVSRVQLDAMMADAVLSGNAVRALPGYAWMFVHLIAMTVMLLICACIRSHRMHAVALAWLALVLMAPVMAIAMAARWFSLGLLPVLCVSIYVYCVRGRRRCTQNLLSREVFQLRNMASELGMAGMCMVLPSFGGSAEASLQQAQHAVREIRILHGTLVGLINQLPYAVFAMTGDEIVMWNTRAAELLGRREAREHVLRLEHVREKIGGPSCSGRGGGEEVRIGGRTYRLLCERYAGPGEAFSMHAERLPATYLVSLLDIGDIKEDVASDRAALRHIAHDLRSPLSTMLSLIEQQSSDRRERAPRDREFLEDLRRHADYSLRVAKDFLQLARAEQVSAANFVPVALEDIAAEAMDQLWEAAKSRSIELIGPECDLECSLVMGSADMLIRAVVNLVDNALKYSPSHSSVRLRLAASGAEHMVLHVIDQGVGISEENLKKLADPFFQVAYQGDVAMGVGLGLSFVKAVAERHGGRMNVSSTPGLGSQFGLVLPRLRPVGAAGTSCRSA